MTGSIVVIGEARIEEIRDLQGARELIAGDGHDLVRRLRREGIQDVALLAAVGDDPAGTRIRASLTDLGVELIEAPAPSGSPRRRIVADASGAVQETRSGEPAIVETRRARSAVADAALVLDVREGSGLTVDAALVRVRAWAVMRAAGDRSGAAEGPAVEAPVLSEGSEDRVGPEGHVAPPPPSTGIRSEPATDAQEQGSATAVPSRSLAPRRPVLAGPVRLVPVSTRAAAARAAQDELWPAVRPHIDRLGT